MHTWTILPDQAKQRLDLFLLQQKLGLSRAAIQKQIKSGAVTVQDRQTTVHHFLKTGDVIAWRPTESAPPSTTKTVQKNHLPTPNAFSLIQETPDWMVIDKPAHLLVHPTAKTAEKTLVDLLLSYDPKIRRIGEDPSRPGIVHRLDREVSGLMVVAKTPAAYDSLKKQFAQRQVQKTYLALVHGSISKDERDIKLAIGRSTTKPRMAAKTRASEGRAAWTHIRVLRKCRQATLVEVTILSGRTHQIRAHLYAIGHPVIGDSLYPARRMKYKIQAPRLMLQSIQLAFADPITGQPQTFSLPPDPAFNQMLCPLSLS